MECSSSYLPGRASYADCRMTWSVPGGGADQVAPCVFCVGGSGSNRDFLGIGFQQSHTSDEAILIAPALPPPAMLLRIITAKAAPRRPRAAEERRSMVVDERERIRAKRKRSKKEGIISQGTSRN